MGRGPDNHDGRVTRLALDRNELSGVLPGALGNLTALEELRLFGIRLTGPIPRELGALPGSRAVSLRQPVDGADSRELGDLSNLEVAESSVQRAGGADSAELATCRASKYCVYGQPVDGVDPAGVGRLAKLERLYLSHNRLSGNIPDTLGSLADLEALGLGETP